MYERYIQKYEWSIFCLKLTSAWIYEKVMIYLSKSSQRPEFFFPSPGKLAFWYFYSCSITSNKYWLY